MISQEITTATFFKGINPCLEVINRISFLRSRWILWHHWHSSGRSLTGCSTWLSHFREWILRLWHSSCTLRIILRWCLWCVHWCSTRRSLSRLLVQSIEICHIWLRSIYWHWTVYSNSTVLRRLDSLSHAIGMKSLS